MLSTSRGSAGLILTMLAITISLLTACSKQDGDTQASEILVSDAWIAEAPPGSNVMVGYMTLENSTDAPIIFSSATSKSYSSIEFHQTVHEDGLARMIRHKSLEVPANGKLVLERGGRHLMLFNPVDHYQAGQQISITLGRDDGTTMTITPEVRKSRF